MKTYSYEIENEGERYEFHSNFVSDTNTGREWVAEDAAKDFFSEHDGWEASWPIEFSIFSVDDGFIGTFRVYCESVPQFSAILAAPTSVGAA